MSRLLNRGFLRCRRGVAAVEFALIVPLLMVAVLGVVETARAFIQANAVEKGLRAGAMYVARAQLPIDLATETAVENLVKYGNTAGVGALLAPGWSEAGADVNVTRLADFTTAGVVVPVFRLTATVPFVPLFQGMPTFTMTRDHEQAHIGN